MNLPAPLSQDEFNARYAATLSILAEILLDEREREAWLEGDPNAVELPSNQV